MATQSSTSAKAPRVKVETAQSRQTTSNAAPKKSRAAEPAKAPAQKATTAPKPRIAGATQQTAKSAPKPKVSVAASQVAASAGESAPAKKAAPAPKAAPAKKAAPKPKVAMAVEPPIEAQPKAFEAEAPAAEQPVPMSTQPVEVAGREEASSAPSTDVDSPATNDSQPKVTNGQRMKNARRSILAWVHTTFPGHEHAFWGGVVALIVALMVFIIGPLRVLLICLLVLIGVAVGQVLDGDPKIIRIIQGLFDNDSDQS